MWVTALPWWEFVLRGAIVYVALMLLIRLSGKRTIGEFTPFDLIVVILVGECAQGAMVGGDQSVIGCLLVAATLMALNFFVGFCSARSPRFDSWVEGEPVVLVLRGEVREAAMLRNQIPLSDLEEAVRQAGLLHARDVELAMLETNGRISIVPKRKSEPQ